MKFRYATFVFFLSFLCLPYVFCADNADFTIKKIGDGVYAAISPDRSKAGSNAGFIIGGNGVAVVDTFVGVEPAKELLAEIRKITSRPIPSFATPTCRWSLTGGTPALI